MFRKARLAGLTYYSLTMMVTQARFEGKTEFTLGLIMLKDDTGTLTQYLSILDQLGTTTTYKFIEGKTPIYKFTIKLNPL